MTTAATIPYRAGPVPACAHCGLPVPAALRSDTGEPSFCCSGCEAVHQAIQGLGLGRFYELADRAAGRRRGRETGRRYAALDDDRFLERHARRIADGSREIELLLEDVRCIACVWLVERLPHVAPGVLEARLDLGRRIATVRWDPERVGLARVAGTLDRLGYPSHPAASVDQDAVRRRTDRRQLVRLGVAAACAGNAMLIAFALYGGMIDGIAADHRMLLRGASLLLALLALAWPGRTFFTGAFTSWRTGRLHMDVPVALALGAGTAWGAVNTFRDGGEVYFESITAVVFLLLLGRFLQHRQQRRAQDRITGLHGVTPERAHRVEDDGTIAEVPVDDLTPGDAVEVRAGMSFPADGRLRRGTTTVDRAILSGESRPVLREPGDAVEAGTVNLERPVEMTVEHVGDGTRIGRLLQSVDRLVGERPPIVRYADRLAHAFVLAVVALAAITVVGWLVLDPGRPGQGIEHAIALLVVTCPCALGIATPLAVMAAVGRAAGAGILVKRGEALEHLARPGVIVLDKTGTITRGRPTVVTWHGAADVKPLVAALEAAVSHPVARAFGESLDAGDLVATDVTSHLGAGIEGQVGEHRVIVGRADFVEARLTETPGAALLAASASDATRCLSPVLIAVDGHLVAAAGIGDAIAEDAAAAIARLRRRGWHVKLLSGDHPDVTHAVARAVGIEAADVEGGASPERKIAAVRAAHATHATVVMVGDGVNDAAALAAATVGVAAHGGAEASLAAADVALGRAGVTAIVDLVDGAGRMMHAIRRLLAGSLVYNVAMAALAVAGVVNPMIAAAVMPLSSLTVVSIAHRTRTFDPLPTATPRGA